MYFFVGDFALNFHFYPTKQFADYFQIVLSVISTLAKEKIVNIIKLPWFIVCSERLSAE